MLTALKSLKTNQSKREGIARRVSRFPIHAPVSLVLENGVVIVGTLRNLSAGGGFLVAQQRPFGLSVGEEGDLGLVGEPDDVEDSGYRFSCRIVRIEEDGLALQFLRTAAEEL